MEDYFCVPDLGVSRVVARQILLPLRGTVAMFSWSDEQLMTEYATAPLLKSAFAAMGLLQLSKEMVIAILSHRPSAAKSARKFVKAKQQELKKT